MFAKKEEIGDNLDLNFDKDFDLFLDAIEHSPNYHEAYKVYWNFFDKWSYWVSENSGKSHVTLYKHLLNVFHEDIGITRESISKLFSMTD